MTDPASSAGTAYYYLGHVAHLVADMTVPAHVHNDQHLYPSDSYEDTIAYSSNFKLWGDGTGSRGGPTGDITEYGSL